VIEIRRANIPKPARTRVIAELDSRAASGVIVYPPEVLAELERAADEIRKKGQSDLPLVWAKKHELNGTRYGHLFDGAKAVLKRVENLIDPAKVSVNGIDDADPHVIALAVYMREEENHDVTIITEDFNTSPKKTGLADAAGVFGIACVRLRTFLITEGIWDGRDEA
jgi:rRNA maturation endonuclease Nob1